MKFWILLVFSALVTTQVSASQIPANKLVDYARAVAMALTEHPLDCNGTNWAYGTIAKEFTNLSFTSGELKDNETQPLIVLNYDLAGHIRYSFEVTTTADYKSVVAVSFKKQSESTGYVNNGNLQHPVMTEETVWQTTDSIGCVLPKTK